MKFEKLTISKIKVETKDTLSLYLNIPHNLAEQFTYRAGQYLTLRFRINGQEERRAYSMSSSPLEKELVVTIKQVAGGKVSSYIHQNLKVGDEVEVLSPQGRFTHPFQESNRKTYYFFGAGSGITPLWSLIKTILEVEPQSSVFLLYGNRDEENIIFKKELDEAVERYAGQFRLDYVLSKPILQKSKGITGLFSKGKIAWNGRVGRIDRKLTADYLEENPAPYPRIEYFICGPNNLALTVEQVLIARGAEEATIHIEHFTTAKEQIAAAESENITIVNATIHLEGKVIKLNIPQHKTIVQALLEAGYEPPYSCQSGSCSTCMAKTLNGKATMDVCHALDKDEVEAGYILTCRAKPLGDAIEVDYSA